MLETLTWHHKLIKKNQIKGYFRPPTPRDSHHAIKKDRISSFYYTIFSTVWSTRGRAE